MKYSGACREWQQPDTQSLGKGVVEGFYSFIAFYLKMWMRRTWCTKLRHIFDLGFGCTHTHLSSGVKRVGWNPSLLQFSIFHCHKISEKSSGGNNASTRWFCNEDCRTLLSCYLDHLHFTGGTFNLTNHLSFFAHFFAANPQSSSRDVNNRKFE